MEERRSCDQDGCKVVLLLSKDVDGLKEDLQRVVESTERNADKMVQTMSHTMDTLRKIELSVDRLNNSMDQHNGMLRDGGEEIRELREKVIVIETKGNRPALISGGLGGGGLVAAIEGLKNLFM